MKMQTEKYRGKKYRGKNTEGKIQSNTPGKPAVFSGSSGP
jgi:hypothetical protein